MANSGSYIDELKNELTSTDPNSHANRLLTQEIDRLTKGEEESKEPATKDRNAVPYIEIHHDRPTRCVLKVKVPVMEFPKYNFVGKLLGPKGNTLKGIQDMTGCKMAIMGKGSMRDKEKEEELRKSGGKYSHLNEDLHVFVECFAEAVEGQHRMAGAIIELKKYLIPEISEMDGSGDGMHEMGMNGASRGRGGFRGAPSDRSRGGFRGRGNGPAGPPGGGRGSAMGRGGPPRGGPRGGPSIGRGGPAGRGAPPSARGRAPVPPSYDSYGNQQSYASGGYDSGYGASYDESYGQESSYYDYGQAGSASSGYDSYSAGGYGDYSEGWSAGGAGATGGMGGGKTSSAPSRGGSRGSRAHPYSRPAAGSY